MLWNIAFILGEYMRRRFWVFFWVSFLGVNSSAAIAQTCNYSRHFADIDGKAVVRDPEAIRLLNQSLQALGGADAWSSVRSLRIKSEREATAHNSAIQLISFEDLSHQEKLRLMRVEKRGEVNAHTVLADEDMPVGQIEIKGRTVNVPPLSALEEIATENPAIAIGIALQSKSISVCLLRNTSLIEHAQDSVTWVRLFRQTRSRHLAVIDLALLQGTSLPRRIRRMLPSLTLYAPPMWQDVTFVGFQPYSGLLLPTEMQTIDPTGMFTSMKITAVEVNPSLADFRAEAK